MTVVLAGRDHLNGALIIDKPAEMTSAQVVARLKKATGVKKIGHAGTLDPFATGVLVCCLNQATRLSRFFLSGHKVYEAEMILGVVTDTLDVTGNVIRQAAHVGVTPDEVRAAFARFTGRIQQQPPVYSALKHHGVPLYKLARQGKPVQKPARTVNVESIRLIEMALPKVVFEVHSSGGTYIRSLCADIGEQLGCGAHLRCLRRTASGHFVIQRALDLAEAEKLALSGNLSDKVMPMTKMLEGMAVCIADDGLLDIVRHGRRIRAVDIGSIGGSDNNGYAGYWMIVDAAGHLRAVIEKTVGDDEYRYCCVFHPPR